MSIAKSLEQKGVFFNGETQ